MTTRQPVTADVIVVGLGPVGAVASLLLARAGLKVIAVEKAAAAYDKPRAIGIDHESLRTLQKICNADAIEELLGPYRASEYRSKAGEVLRRVVPQPPPHPLAWPPSATFIQPELEKLLRTHLEAARNIRLLWSHEAVAVSQEPDAVLFELKRLVDGAQIQISAPFAIACDGASSFVRRSLAIELEDLGFDEPWLVVDVLLESEDRLPDHVIQFCNPDRPCTFVPGPRALRRWEFMMLPGEDPAEMVKDARVWELLSPWLSRSEARIWRAACYRFHALVAQRWRDGRCFLAGDAAHQTPPFMAQGLNQGIRDAANLTWKLALVLQTAAHPGLLDTYEHERRPNAHAVIALTKRFGQLICERDPVAAAVRDKELLAEMEAGRGEIIRQDLLPPLQGGFLHGSGTDPAVGHVFPQPFVAAQNAKVRMDDVFASRTLLVVADPGWLPSKRTYALAMELDVALAALAPISPLVTLVRDESGVLAAWFARYGLAAALVRPDHVVFATCATAAAAEDLLLLLKARLQQLPHAHG